MSTDSDSKYVIARRAYLCAHCAGHIQKGERHLAYKPGLRRTTRICLKDSAARRKNDDGLMYNCAAVRAELAFNEFQASGRAVDNLQDVREIADAYPYKVAGRVYAGNLAIEESCGAAGGAWSLTVGNASRLSDDLPSLERDLFAYGKSEGLI